MAADPPKPARTIRATVMPKVIDEQNALSVPLETIAHVHVEDAYFDFSMSFPLPDASRPLAQLAGLRERHPGAQVALFGHSDRVGAETFNKKLSGRRALAIYATLTRDVERFDALYGGKLGNDDWKRRPVQTMLLALGFSPGPIDGIVGNRTKEAIRQFQSDRRIPTTGNLNPTTREALFEAYMDVLCVDAHGVAYRLPPADFLGSGVPGDAKMAVQGCGPANPVLVPSLAEDQHMSQPAQTMRRNFEYGVNRRVSLHLFHPSTIITPGEWPCPAATEGPDACHARFWSDADVRMGLGPARRHIRETQDTFGCRFYHRVTLGAPAPSGVVRAGRVRAAWSKHRVQPLRNESYPPATPPTDVVPDACRVELLVDVDEAPDETPARIRIRGVEPDRAVPHGDLPGLVVRDGRVVDSATGAAPVWTVTADHGPWQTWDRAYFYFEAEVNEVTAQSPRDFAEVEEEVLRVDHWHVSVCDAHADTPEGGSLTTQEEMYEVADLQKLEGARGVVTHAFNQSVTPVSLWGSLVRNSYAYHHASHGDVVCRVDGASFEPGRDDMPAVCPNDAGHAGRSTVWLWDTVLGDVEVSTVDDVPSTPLYLVYFNTCVTGWEPSFAHALLARGTQYVIAFRKYIPDGAAREMARLFYRKWAQVHRGNPDKIAEVFQSIAPAFHASMWPVLFGAAVGAPPPGAGAAIGKALGAIA